MADPTTSLVDLQETVRLLTLENDRLSERATDLHLLGQLAAQTAQTQDPEEVLRLGLEQIALLKDIPLCTAWQHHPDSGCAVLRHTYSTLDTAPAPGTTLELTGLATAQRVLHTRSTNDPLLARLAACGFAAQAALRFPMDSGPGFSGFFVFADHRPDHRLQELAPLIGRAADLVGARHLNLRLQQALERSNCELEARVTDRTRTLREAFTRLQEEMLERQRSDKALRESEQRFRLLAEASFEGISVSRDGVFVDLNEQLAQLLGWTRPELLGRSVLTVVAPECRETVRAAVAAHRTATYDHLALRKDGTTFPVEIRARSTELEGRTLRLAAVRDLSEQRRAEEERRQFEAALQQTQKLESLGVLAGGIAHDFNNLLTGILGNTGLAKADVPPASPALEPLHEIELAARRAAELCRQLLAYSGRARLAVQPLDFRQLVRETLELLRTSLDKKTLLQCQLPESLPTIDADTTQIRQVLMNLVINASEALEGREGLVRIAVSSSVLDQAPPPTPDCVGTLAPGPHVCLEVSDTGCGMDAATQARVFEPFFTTKFTGRGLGLSAVLGIVRSHKGAIEVESQPGQGTRFRLWFPASTQPEPPAAASNPASTSAAPAAAGSGHILLVDDEETVRHLGRRILERAGFRVTTATDGLAALDLFQKDPTAFDCVVLDLTMPRMDGTETLRALSSLRPALPILLASGYTEHELSERFRHHQLAGFLEKPYEVETLVRRVCESLRQAGAAGRTRS